MTEFARSTWLPPLEARRSCQENTCYRPHTHDTVSIGLVQAGESVFSGALTGPVRLTPGDVIVIGAGHVHQCNPCGGTWRYQMTHVDHSWAASLARYGAESLLGEVAIVRDPALGRIVIEWGDLVFADADAAALADGFTRLLEALQRAAIVRRVPSEVDLALRERLRPVLTRLSESAVPPSLDELGALVGRSRYQVVRLVKRATGLSPVAWRQNARITRARHLLAQGWGIADAAHALGFADQSHFHRVFRSHVASTPAGYRG